MLISRRGSKEVRRDDKGKKLNFLERLEMTKVNELRTMARLFIPVINKFCFKSN